MIYNSVQNHIRWENMSLTDWTTVKFCPQTRVAMPASRMKADEATSDGGIDGVDFNAVLITIGLEELFNNEIRQKSKVKYRLSSLFGIVRSSMWGQSLKGCCWWPTFWKPAILVTFVVKWNLTGSWWWKLWAWLLFFSQSQNVGQKSSTSLIHQTEFNPGLV